MANYRVEDGVTRIPNVLFFTAGMVPTDAELDEIAKYRPNVRIRNATMVAALPFDSLESCDAVAGAVPDRYAKVYPDVSGFDASKAMLRMSDLDRFTGKVTDVDNEAARGARPPSVGADQVMAQDAPRPAGAITQAGGGFVAPQPSNPDALQPFGRERSVNGPAGGITGPAAVMNPHNLPETGAVAIPAGTDAQLSAAAPESLTDTTGGFTSPTPAEKSSTSRKKSGDNK